MTSKGPISDAHTGPEAAAIRLQLERLLTSSHFRTSKRCHALLTHVVEAYLGGSLDRVKERVIGSEVFGRDHGYDTNQDSVVRTTAAEVRKRLAQYYLDPGHEYEIRLLLPHGSYVPEFRLPAPVASVTAPATIPEVLPEPTRARRPGRWVWAAVALIPLVAAGAWYLPHLRLTELDAFWRPLIEDRADIVICIEQPLRIYTFDGPRVDELNAALHSDETGSTEAML